MTPTEILSAALVIARKEARISLRVFGGQIEWKTKGEWQPLLSIDDLRGADGRDGQDGADGAPGRDGADGANGKDGRDGRDGERGPPGRDGVDGADGQDGADGADGSDGADGRDGADGLPGQDGVDGAPGRDGPDGADGVGIDDLEIDKDGDLIITLTNGSEINAGRARGRNGINGSPGRSGLSAYQVAVNRGFEGDEAAWLASLVGADGPPGPQGDEGPPGPGIAEGGTAGQMLVKASDTDFDTEWVDSSGGGASVTVDTRANILAIAGEDGDLAYASDTQEGYVYQGGWKQSSAIHLPRPGAVDMGVEQASSLAGYGTDYVTDKTLSNVAVGGNADPREGAVRKVFASRLGRNLFQVYLQGDWQTILTGVNIQTDATEDVPDIEFTDFAPWVLSLITGNSDRLALDGTPLVKEMKIDMGAYSADLVIDGGSF